MTPLRKIIIIAFIINVYTMAFTQQEHMVTQFMFNKMALNPAYAGHDKYLSITGMMRDQWNGVPGAPKTQIITVNLPRRGNKFGYGFSIKNNTVGIFKNLQYSGIYSYKFLLGDNAMLSMGLEFLGKNLVSDFTKPDLVASQGLTQDPSIPQSKISQNYFNVGYGIYCHTPKYYFGISVPKLIRNNLDYDNNTTISDEVRHLYVMGGGSWPVHQSVKLNAQILLKMAEHSPFDVDINSSVVLDEKYNFGLTYRHGGGRGDVGESIDLIFGFDLTEQIMVGFSHDFTLSDIRSFDNGSIELLVKYAIGNTKKKVVVVNPRYF
jgi:type IX secretion system PorP/SprF family membrane protein